MRVSKQISDLRKHLLEWGNENTKSYPWRWVNDPYRILVSEFMLHRTQAKQVIPIYEQFIVVYPDLRSFSQADHNETRTMLSSLGLQWRIDGMIRALAEIWESYQEVPPDQEKLRSIDGIGQYIAGATICFSLNEPVTLIDTNTVRVVGRVFGLDLSGEARRRKSVVLAIKETCDPDNPCDYYYSMIDLAHQICKVRTPLCVTCPLLDLPCAYGNSMTKE
mgnify:CR=1 FL=1